MSNIFPDKRSGGWCVGPKCAERYLLIYPNIWIPFLHLHLALLHNVLILELEALRGSHDFLIFVRTIFILWLVGTVCAFLHLDNKITKLLSAAQPQQHTECFCRFSPNTTTYNQWQPLLTENSTVRAETEKTHHYVTITTTYYCNLYCAHQCRLLLLCSCSIYEHYCLLNKIFSKFLFSVFKDLPVSPPPAQIYFNHSQLWLTPLFPLYSGVKAGQ